MPLLTVFSMTFAHADSIVTKLAAATGYKILTDEDLIKRASEASGFPADKLMRAFQARTSVFNRFTCEKERSIAALRLSLAEKLDKEGFIVHGFSSQLLPRNLSPTLRLGLAADLNSRIRSVREEHDDMAQEEASIRLQCDDQDRTAWVKSVTGAEDPWDSALYDLVLSTDQPAEDEIVVTVLEMLQDLAERITDEPGKTFDDFRLSAQVESILAREGHIVGVSAEQGEVLLTIYKPVLLPNLLQEELERLAGSIAGVRSVSVQIAPAPFQTDFYRKCDPADLSRVLLVDDEREFVQTLSERLLMRDVGSVVVYDGESALECIYGDEPEVMILDLKMPGMNGFEVLRRTKEERPSIEVIVVTGHGTETDRKICMELGAFACFQKPIDIDVLCRALREANEKAAQSRHRA